MLYSYNKTTCDIPSIDKNLICQWYVNKTEKITFKHIIKLEKELPQNY